MEHKRGHWLYLLRYAKTHLSGLSDVEQFKNQACSFAIVDWSNQAVS